MKDGIKQRIMQIQAQMYVLQQEERELFTALSVLERQEQEQQQKPEEASTE
ncbi:hypothetical protein [Paenibacillus caseinilyticus]|uniref:hypothetical protein n=1 Tax=Paenibacillus caseinilyticus TaxID=3098138 RepID=UPI0022B92BBA|nr:hypothetical protein [Paenibacillus caseinilyticus]MCZ8518897.1 hypothetical protein [Paenibacillus caseinilyticus]